MGSLVHHGFPQHDPVNYFFEDAPPGTVSSVSTATDPCIQSPLSLTVDS